MEQSSFLPAPPAMWTGGLPLYVAQDTAPVHSITVNFDTSRDMMAFSEAVGQRMSANVKSIWYPRRDLGTGRIRYVDSPDARKHRHPIYIVSKGRWDNQLTNKALDRAGVHHYVVVEEHEYADYVRTSRNATVLILPESYKREYETCDNIEYGKKGTGPGPARNFAWDHSISIGATRHWVMDDNIRRFMRLQGGLRYVCISSAMFAAAEDWVERYEDVPVAGLQYAMFATCHSYEAPPVILNTRIYSCLLIENDQPIRWRGRYNEDTDLSLRVLKAGKCTAEFYVFLQEKIGTQRMRGGNTAEFYGKEGTRAKTDMLVRMHPDVARAIDRYSRYHHYVDYSRWAGRFPTLRKGVDVTAPPDEYGIVRQEKDEAGRWATALDQPYNRSRGQYVQKEKE